MNRNLVSVRDLPILKQIIEENTEIKVEEGIMEGSPHIPCLYFTFNGNKHIIYCLYGRFLTSGRIPGFDTLPFSKGLYGQYVIEI